MLLLGFMGELGKMSIVNSVIVGMVFFLYTFYLIWEEYAKHSDEIMDSIRSGKFVYDISGAAR